MKYTNSDLWELPEGVEPNSQMWNDGICESCGSTVLEGTCDILKTGVIKDDEFVDYVNTCTNDACKNYKWHHIGSGEYLDYYKHNHI